MSVEQTPHDPTSYPPQDAQKVAPGVPDMTPPALRKSKRNLIISGIVAMLVLLGLGGGIAAMAHPGGSSSTAVSATPTPKATATPDRNSHAYAVAYVNIMTTHLDTLSTDGKNAETDCAKTDGASLLACKDDMQTIKNDALLFQVDLENHPAPPCLSKPDALLRQALALLQTGSQDVSDGIDNHDASLVNKGGALYKQAGSDMMTASQEVDNSHCP